MLKHLRINLLLVITLLYGGSFFAQKLNTSPYTRFGLGEYFGNYSTVYSGLSGAAVALTSRFDKNPFYGNHINFSNPATYGTIAKYKPVMNVAVQTEVTNFNTENSSSFQSTTALRNFSLMLPITSRTGFTFGVMPFSTMGYNISSSNADSSITYNFNGDGSANKIFFGLGQQVVNRGDSVRFSVGLNAEYIFGTLRKERNVIFDDQSFQNSRVQEKNILSGMNFLGGIHYLDKINDNYTLQLGATFRTGKSIGKFQDLIAYNYALDGTTGEAIGRDTVKYDIDIPVKYYLPSEVNIGAAVTIKDKWTFTGEYQFVNWHNYKQEIDSMDVFTDELRQSSRFILGAEYHSNKSTAIQKAAALKLATYRFGMHYGNTPYYINDTHIKDIGISFGMSVPMISSYSLSTLNLGIEMGMLGTKENNLVQENYIKVNLGFSLAPHGRFDNWFMKRLYE